MSYDPPEHAPRPDRNDDPYMRARPVPPPAPSGLGGNVAQSCLVAGCVTVLVPFFIVFGFFFLIYLLASSSLEQGTGGPFGSLYRSSVNNNLNERVIREGGGGTVALISIQGVIGGGGSTLEGDGSLSFISEQLRAAGDDDAIKAVILQVDSPGGGLTASDQLHREVMRLKEKGVPVLAWAGSMMASGGYYIAVAADEIMASPTSTVGSIGVIMQHFQVRELLSKIGVRVDPITSGAHKDLASPFRDMTPEERGLLQDYIDIAHRRFVDIVAAGRKMPVEKVRDFADGRIFSADVAREKGLVDSIGYIDDAVAWAEKKTGHTNMRVIGYRRVITFSDIFRDAGRGAAEAVVESAAGEAAPRAMAVWEGK